MSPKSPNFESNISLGGSLRDKIDKLSQRESDLLMEISSLKKKLDRYKFKNRKINSESENESVVDSTRGSGRSSRQSKRFLNKFEEKEKLDVNKKFLFNFF